MKEMIFKTAMSAWIFSPLLILIASQVYAQTEYSEDKCVGGTAFSSSDYGGGYVALAAFDNILGDNSWCTTGSILPNHAWIAYGFSNPEKINKVRIRSRDNFLDLRFFNFTIQASDNSTNGENGNWVTLASFLEMSAAYEWNDYVFENNNAYQMYRVSTNSGGGLRPNQQYYICVSEIEMMELIGGSTPATQYKWTYGSDNSVYYPASVGIGTTKTADYMLSVNGKIRASEGVKVYSQTQWPDFVFEKNYTLRSLTEIENFIKVNGHLPEMPSAKEVEKEGVELGAMDAKLLQKIEELTLFMIDVTRRSELLEKTVSELKKENEVLKKEVNQLKENNNIIK